MPADQQSERDEWRLGIEPGERHDGEALRAPTPHDLARHRLERPVVLITVERLYWAIIALYAVASRCLMLGRRPLGPAEARQALAAYQTMHVGVTPGPPAAWIQLLDAALLAAGGTSDLSARLLFAFGGIALVLIAFAFRRSIGRTGALAMATLAALSPSITYFARSGVTQELALLAALTVVVLFEAIARHPSVGRAIGLGCAIGLALSADAQNLVVGASFAVGLALMGIWRLANAEQRRLNFRIWWQRYAQLLLMVFIFAVLSWSVAGSGFFSQPFFHALGGAMRANWAGPAAPGSALGLGLAMVTFYEFLIAVAALIGALVVVTNLAGARFPLAVFSLIWTIMAGAFFLLTPVFSPAWIVEILVPAIVLGGIGIEALSRTRGWSLIFYPLAALGLATLCVQMATNFAIVAPDPTEAVWARHALLFWSEPTTAAGAREALQRAVAADPASIKTAWVDSDSSVLRWYLRNLRPAHNAAGADLIAGAGEAPTGWPIGGRSSFDLESWWRPDLRGLSARQAIRFLLLARSWRGLESREVTVLTRVSQHSAPTTIYYSPAPQPSATATPTAAPTLTITPSETPIADGESPAATPSSATTAAPQPTP
jgi:predicted membrane-bound mannosyltransferase